MSAKALLDQLQVQSPCTASWDSMIGTDQIRFCGHCHLSVHNLSSMTRKDVRRLVRKSKGRLCVRYESRPEGPFTETVLMMLDADATTDLVWDLINAGADVNARDNEDNTPLIEVASGSNVEVLKTLLEAGAKVNATNKRH